MSLAFAGWFCRYSPDLLREQAADLRDQLSASASSVRLFVLRSPTDEAFVSLTVAQALLFFNSLWERILRVPLAGYLLTVIVVALIMWATLPKGAPEVPVERAFVFVSLAVLASLVLDYFDEAANDGKGDRSMWRSWSWLALVLVVFWIAALGLEGLATFPNGRPVASVLGLLVFPLWLAIMFLPIYLGAAACVFALVAGLWLLCFGVVGWSIAAPLLLKLSVEPAPPGVWELRQLAWPEIKQTWAHSLSWQHPDALQQIRDWLHAVQVQQTTISF